MKKKSTRLISLLLTLCLTAGLLAGITLTASAATPYYSTEKLQQMVVDTALAYFYKGGAVQYDSYYLTPGGRYKSSILRQSNNRDPEDATLDNPIFTVCSAFPHDVYFSLFGHHIMTNSTVDEEAKLSNTHVDVSQFDGEEDPALDYVNSILAVTAKYSLYGQQAAVKAALKGYDINTMTQAQKDALAAELNDPNIAMVVKYYGATPPGVTDVQTKPIGTLSAEQVVAMFEDDLQPGDIVVGMQASGDSDDDSSDSGHAMLYVGDVDGDGIGELLHSSGDKYNKNFAPTAAPYWSAYATPKVLEETVLHGANYNTAQLPYLSELHFSNEKDGVFNKDKGDYYLRGFDIVEAPMSWWRSNAVSSSIGFIGDGKNYKGGSNGAMVGPAWQGEHGLYNKTINRVDMGGGSIRMDDWITQCGPYTKFTATGTAKKTAQGVYQFDKNTDSGSFYPGGTAVRSDGTTENTSTLNKFTVLRPLENTRIVGVKPFEGDEAAYDEASARNAFQSGNLTAAGQGRYWLRDLSVTKSASPNVFGSVTPGGTITYTVELKRPVGVFNNNNVTISPPVVQEFLPEGATLSGDPVVTRGEVSVEGSTVLWKVGAAFSKGDTATLTYTVTVPAAAQLGDAIVSPAGRVGIISGSTGKPSTSSYLHTSRLVHYVGGKSVQGSFHRGMNVTEKGSGMDIAKAVYAKAGISLKLPSVHNIGSALLTEYCDDTEKASNKYHLMQKDPSGLEGAAKVLSDMVVPGYVGGYWLYTTDENGIRTNENRLRMYGARFLTPGDILVYGKATTSHTSLQDRESKVYVYLGEDTYAYFDDAGNYIELYDPVLDVQHENNIRFMYSRVLTQCFLQDFFCLLRPSRVEEDLTTAKVLNVEIESGDGDATMTFGGETTTFYGTHALADAIGAATEAETSKTQQAQIVVNSDQNITAANASKFFGTIDLQGHTVTCTSHAYLNFLEKTSGATGETVTLKNGKVFGQEVAIYAGNSAVVHLENIEAYGGTSNTYAPGSLCFDGYAVARGGGSKVYLKDCLVSTAGKVKPLNSKENFFVAGKLTILDPVEKNTTLCDYNGGYVVSGTTNNNKEDTPLPGTTTPAMKVSKNAWDVNTMRIDPAFDGTLYTGAKVTRQFNGGAKMSYNVYYFTDKPVAKIGATEYPTLAEAVNKLQPGQTLTLLQNVTLPDKHELYIDENYFYRIENKQNIVVDFNEKTLTDYGVGKAPMRIVCDAEVKNGTAIADCSSGVITTGPNSKVTFTNMTVKQTGNAPALFQSQNGTGMVTISDSSIRSEWGPALQLAGSSTAQGGATIQDNAVLYGRTGAVITQGSNKALLNVADAILAVDGDTVVADTLTLTGTYTDRTSYLLPDGTTAAKAWLFLQTKSGNCGDGLTWELEGGTLTITGSGEMTGSPWTEYAEYITKVQLPEGLTAICTDAFEGCSSITSVTYGGTGCQWEKVTGKDEVPVVVTTTGAHGTLEHQAAVDPTATADGNKEYWRCPVCDKHFMDETGTEAYENNGWVIPATGGAEIGGETYSSLVEAISAVQNGQTINVQTDMTLTDNATLKEGATLDAGENTITVTPGMTLTVAGTLKGAVTGDVAVTGNGRWEFTDGAGKDVIFKVPTGYSGSVRYDDKLTPDWSLNLDSAIRLNFYAVKDGKMYVDGKDYGEYENGSGFYPTKPFNAREMSKKVPVTVVAPANGTASGTLELSIRDHALSALKQVYAGTKPHNLGALMVSMLNYGAAAQTYFGDTSGILANEGTEDYQKYVTTRDVATHEAPKQKKDGDVFLYYGTACVLGENMNMKFYLDLRNVEQQERENYTYEISFVPCGKTKETVIPLSFNELQSNETDGFYSYTLTQLVAKDIDTPVTFKILDGGTEKLSVTDSISGYLARVAKNRPECENVANAMLTFGIAAREYFIGNDPTLGDDELPLG